MQIENTSLFTGTETYLLMAVKPEWKYRGPKKWQNIIDTNMTCEASRREPKHLCVFPQSTN